MQQSECNCACNADVYERLTPKGKKATFKTLLLTQLVAGVWHGLFPGYALFFATSAFMFESAKVIYRYEQVCGSLVRTPCMHIAAIILLLCPISIYQIMHSGMNSIGVRLALACVWISVHAAQDRSLLMPMCGKT